MVQEWRACTHISLMAPMVEMDFLSMADVCIMTSRRESGLVTAT